MPINKVVFGNETLIDLTTDTVASADDILLGKVGHLRDGTVVTGTASGGDPHGTIWQDGQGYVHLDDESGIALQSKTIDPTSSVQIITADPGYYALEQVTVNAGATDPYPLFNDGYDHVYIQVPSLIYPTVTVNVYSSKTNGCLLDWGDGSSPEILSSGNVSHTYSETGIYVITLKKNVSSATIRFRQFYVNNDYSTYSRVLAAEIYNEAGYQFQNCTNVEKVTFQTATTIPYGAFMGCERLKTVDAPMATAIYTNTTFYNCTSLNDIDLSSLAIYSDVQMTSTFLGCNNLVSVKLPTGADALDNTFNKCYSLQNVTIPSTVTKLLGNTFYECRVLKQITIPASVVEIDNAAFSGCSALSEVHVLPTTPPTAGNTIFYGAPSDMIIYVPSASLEAYKTASNWSIYASNMQGE